ncbi:hypothetical protein JQC92_02595 [Shewanella sp. 202IG2-18]|uniref:hypothetical protein n=1 Tax=Parashewanella hymeniacidonis TaxID=2807618 RepID=UPI00195FEE8F|nr:hypothetical protein [Parashewanella hymeniacidonis]MBM7070931.1 hypothetical protein [Parashewanella hymeniacidonis]
MADPRRHKSEKPTKFHKDCQRCGQTVKAKYWLRKVDGLPFRPICPDCNIEAQSMPISSTYKSGA